MHTERRRLDAALVYLIFSGGGSLFSTLVFSVNLIYQVQVAHLNPLQLVLVGTMLEATAFLFEVPTGIVADVYSRRLSVIIGVFLLGVWPRVAGCRATLRVILLAQVIWGIGSTFTSGAEEAWITDEVGETRAANLFLRASQLGLIGGFSLRCIGTAIGNFNLRLPILIGGGLYLVLGVFLIVADAGTWLHPRTARRARLVAGDGRDFRRGPLARAPLTRAADNPRYRRHLRCGDGGVRPPEHRSLPQRISRFQPIGNLQPVVWLGGLSIAGRLVRSASRRSCGDGRTRRATARWRVR